MLTLSHDTEMFNLKPFVGSVVPRMAVHVKHVRFVRREKPCQWRRSSSRSRNAAASRWGPAGNSLRACNNGSRRILTGGPLDATSSWQMLFASAKRGSCGSDGRGTMPAAVSSCNTEDSQHMLSVREFRIPRRRDIVSLTAPRRSPTRNPA